MHVNLLSVTPAGVLCHLPKSLQCVGVLSITLQCFDTPPSMYLPSQGPRVTCPEALQCVGVLSIALVRSWEPLVAQVRGQGGGGRGQGSG